MGLASANSSKGRRLRSRRFRRVSKAHPLLGVTVETSAKLLANIFLSAIALVILARTLPEQIAQKQRLEELTTQVQQAELRVNELQTDFHHAFDPTQEAIAVQERSNYISPRQQRIIWVKPEQ
jgi:cell division protein FtsB